VTGTRRALAASVFLAGVAAVFLFWRWPRPSPPPPDVRGTLYFVSDREGMDALYIRHLPRGEAIRLAITTEPVRDPALSKDGSRLAFAMGGRLGLVSLPMGDVRFVTLGVDYRDAQPSWRPDGKAVVVSARARTADAADLHILELDREDGAPLRTPLTQTRGLDETSPAFSPDGAFVVFVREDNIFRVSLADGRTTRLTGGIRKFRAPRFLPSGRLICLWDEGKRYGLEAMDGDGKNRETLSQGTTYYRAVTSSPDGKYLAATFTFDLGFNPRDAFKARKTEEGHLLDDHGRFLVALESSVRESSHSPVWGR
jgi:Tol biopolymer transport system component